MSVNVEIKKKLGDFTLDLHLESESRRIGILGASGCGKSMTLKSIAGIEKPDSGCIIIDGKKMYDSSEKKCNWKPQQRNIGYLFQNYALFPTMTVRENIGIGLKCEKEEKKAKVDEMLKKFQLEGLENHLPGELSGGQQQRTALARIMIYEPDMILLDEPFSALDMFLKDRLQQELQEMLVDYEGTVILVSHNRDEIYQLCDELLIMDRGHDICCGKTKDIFEKPVYKEAARLTGCKNIVPIQKIDAHTAKVPLWGMTLKLQQEIADDIQYVGLRAHDFVPIWSQDTAVSGEQCNWVSVNVKSVADLPFERKYFLHSQVDDAEDICWFVQRDEWDEYDTKGIPQFLEIPEEKLLLLKD